MYNGVDNSTLKNISSKHSGSPNKLIPLNHLFIFTKLRAIELETNTSLR